MLFLSQESWSLANSTEGSTATASPDLNLQSVAIEKSLDDVLTSLD